MIAELQTYAVGCLAAASLLLAWFHSGLPIHVIRLLRITGWNKDRNDFWDTLNSDWQTALNVYYPNLLSELLTCPVCLSFHISFWVGVTSLLFIELPLWYPIITAVSWPILLNLVMLNFRHE